MITNEQSILAAEKEINAIKEKYIDLLKPIAIKYQTNNSSIKLNDFLACQKLGNQYFNYVEQFVGDSGLLGAHYNGKWVTGFAETCHSTLEAFIVHMEFLRSWKKHLKIEANIEPNPNAYANMQRMVVEYLPKNQIISLKEKFISNNLPTHGFEYKGTGNMEKTAIWKEITAVVLAIIFLIFVSYLAVEIPHPSAFQTFIFRGIFSISLSLLAFLIPGFLKFESKYIKATGAIVIFIIVWLINPPSLLQP